MADKQFHSTPPKPTLRGVYQYSAKAVPLAKTRREQLCKNMEGYVLGPMDPHEFMRAFMPVNSRNLGSPPVGIDFSQVCNKSSEKDMYEPFVDIANKVCTNYEAKFTGDQADPEASLKPDITFFSKNNAPSLQGASNVTSFLHMEMFVELKRDALYDPFRDLGEGMMGERTSINGSNTRGQCLLYAANQLAYQHRLFAFSLVICGQNARFIRWDREGGVVSAAVDCLQCKNNPVIEFLQRFNQLTAEQRGWDPTAVPATPEEIEMFESAVAKVEIESLKLTVGDRGIYPRFRLEVRGANHAVSYYVVGRALDYSLGVTGRCTRGFLALDVSTKKCVFLKDMWRPDVAAVKPEHVWYEKLAEAKVPHLIKFKHASDVVPSTPPIYYHGTVALDRTEATSRDDAQRGLTSRLKCLFHSESLGTKLQGHIHYRLVQSEICRSLSEFTNSRHLVLVVLDSLKACSAAFVDARVFHRDASLGNIMIGLDGKGRLNDWDLCRDVNVDKSLEGPRTGTWQFMSTRLLTTPGSRHTITDDLESHFFVLMWAALHWVEHNRPGDSYVDMEQIFDQQRPSPGGIVKGGLGKVSMYGASDSELHDIEFACEPFNKLFWVLWKLFAKYLTRRWNADLEGDPVSPQEVIGLFEAALEQPGWIDDKVADQLPRSGGKNASSMALSDLDNGGNCRNPNQGKKRGFTKSLGIELELFPAKRQRVVEP